MTTLGLLLALAAPSSAAIRCPQGSEAALTGQPLRPVDCESPSSVPTGEAPQYTTTLPEADVARADLKPLDGRWRGIITAMGGHFELALDVSGSGKSWLLSTTELRGLRKTRLGAQLKLGLFSRKPPFIASVTSPDLPERSMAATVWTGAAPLESGRRPEFDRLAVWTYAGRPGAHRVQYAVAGDKLRGIYTYVDPKLGPIATSFELAK